MGAAHLGFVWLATARDLQWRWRRFVLAVFAIALVFAITLLASGFGESFNVEARRLAGRIDADGYILREGATGPFTSPKPFSLDVVADIAATEGVRSVAPLIALLQPDVYLLGSGDRQRVVADDTFRGEIGEPLSIGIKDFTVDELSYGRTVFGGVPIVELSYAQAQQAVFAGQPLVTALGVKGTPRDLPVGYVYVTRGDAESDFLRPIAPVRLTVRILSVMLWLVAASIVGTLVYISTMERTRDLAVYKATGASSNDLLGALIAQAVLVSLVASVTAIGLAYASAPLFPRPIYFPARLLMMLPAIGLVIGLLASLAGLRRALRVDPALAMGLSG